MLLTLASAAALLPIYSGEAAGEWSSNHRFVTELRGEAPVNFCLLRSAIDETDNGIEYRVGVAFGARNELSLATTSDGLAPQGAITVTIDETEFTFSDMLKEPVRDRLVMRWSMSKAMMAKLLSALRPASSATILMHLKYGDVVFSIPTTQAAETFADAKSCEDHRLGKVLPD